MTKNVVQIVDVRFTRRHQGEYAYTSKVYTYAYDGPDILTKGDVVCVPVQDMAVDNYAIAVVDKATTIPVANYDVGPEYKFIIGPVPVKSYRERAVDRIKKRALAEALDARVAIVATKMNREIVARNDLEATHLLAMLNEGSN